MDYKLNGEGTTKLSECEERQRLRIEVGGMSQSASVIESVNVEEDQEVCDQCQTEEARSRQGETEEQTQVEDQVEE